MKISSIYKLYTKSYLVSTDTRKVTKGCIFFALKGDNFNGNAFAEEALKKGASYAIIDDPEYKKSDVYILVDDVLKTLQELANFHRRKLEIPIISLTGSNGKTTTKELINAVLSKTFNTTATLGNLNNHIGVPLTLLTMTPNTEVGIVEMGANHLGEIKFLCDIAEPDYGYITNFGKAHLEGFGGIEGVIKGKSELYNYLRENHKMAFVNAKDSMQNKKAIGIKQFTFNSINSDLNIEFIEANPFVKVKYNSIVIKSNLIGLYNAGNISAAIAIGNYFKVEDVLIKEAIEEYVPSNNRSQIIEKESNKIILDAYNANPSSMQAALENFSNLEASYKVAVLGDMFELGEESKLEHQKIADLVIALEFNDVFLVGDNFDNISNKTIKTYRTFEDFKDFFSDQKLQNSTILIKGSRGMALERILDVL